MYLLAEFQRAGDAKIAPGFMFDVAQRADNADDLGPWLVEERRGRHIGNRYRSGMQNGVDK